MLNDPGGAVRLLTCRTADGETLGVAVGDRWSPARDLLPGGPSRMTDLLAAGADGLRSLADAAVAADIPRTGLPVAEADLMAPLPRPGKIIAIGRNYKEHAAEEGVEPPTAPLIFSKWPSCVIGPGEDIRWDPALTQQVDYEAELAVVIGRAARRVTPEAALEHVFGYTCLNDVSARDLQFGDGQWARGKSLETFAPMGPVIVTADEIPDPQRLPIRCIVDGEVMQESNTSQMYFSVADIISYCSQSFTLEPGDVISTGTPSGVGVFADPPHFLGDGARIVVEIEGIGALENTARFDLAGARE
jgi:2-keto-4-pentenoate hydratase/2-oxohepta-3-ene-1,7-dioic acid hydratase in catechol pathway